METDSWETFSRPAACYGFPVEDLPGYLYWHPVWEACWLTTPLPGTRETIVAALLVVTFIAAPKLLRSNSILNPARFPKFSVTQTHEGAHALIAKCSRQRVSSIRLERDHSGSTTSTVGGGLGAFLTQVAGYFGPVAVAAGIAALTGLGHATLAVAAYALFSVCMLPLMRNLTGFVFVGTIAAATGFVVWIGESALSNIVALTLCWYLAVAGAASAWEQRAVRRHSGYAGGADADGLARTTGVPAIVWVWVHILGCMGVAAWTVYSSLRLGA